MDPNINAHSSVDDIDNEKVLAHVMLDTLDPGDDEYFTRKQDLEAQINYYEQLLQQKQAPPPTPSMVSPSSSNLPSRSRPSIPNWGNREPSPSERRLSEQSMRQDQQDSAASARARKRPRQDTLPGTVAGSSSSKLARTYDARPESSSTSDSFDSLYESGENSKGQVEDLFETYKRRAREEEARFERQRLDEEFARQLSQQAEPSKPAPLGNTSNYNYNQAYLGANGDIHRPQPQQSLQPSNGLNAAAADQWPLNSLNQDIFGESLSGPSSWPHVNPKSEPSPFLGYAQAQQAIPHIKSEPHGNTSYDFSAFPRKHGFDDDDDDDDLSIISPEHFKSSVSQSRGRSHKPEPAWESLESPMPSAFPQPTFLPHINEGFVNPAQITQGGGLHSEPQMTNEQERIRQHFRNGATSMSGMYHGSAGDSVFGSTNPSGYAPVPVDLDEYDSDSGLTRGQLADLHSRNWDSMLADPGKTKEDIAQLLENIRPDEDLPPELRDGGPPELAVPLMEHQKVGLSWLKKQEESSIKGSILADDMGLGKTIQALALILDRKSSDPTLKTTLVVAPVALMRQWQKEIATRVLSRRPLKVHIYHGTGQKWGYRKLAQ